MAQATPPMCPRCGQRLNAGRARFCSRCGLDLQAVGLAPPAATTVEPPFPPPRADVPPRWPAMQAPPAPPPTYAPPMMVMGPPGAMPQPGRAPLPPKAKSSSGCGCLLMVLLVVGILVAIGANSQSRVWTAQPIEVPSRPTTSLWNGLDHNDKPDILNASVFCFDGGTFRSVNLQVDLKVRNGDYSKVLVAVYPMDKTDYVTHQNSEAIAARWVESSFIPRKMRTGTDVNISVLLPPGPTPDRVQISLFDEHRRELRRQMLNVPK